MTPMLQLIRKIGIVPVIKITDPDTAVPLARALNEGGIPVAEVTFRTEYAAEAIRRISKEVPDVLVGAGTVLTCQQVDQAVEAGAKFIVTPGFNPTVVDYCLDKQIPVLPGAPSTSDIEKALERGLEVVKCFPAEALGGLSYIKAVAAPYGSMMFMPTGGVNPGNINSYLSFNKILACGGSWMIDSKRIAAGDYDGIADLCREAVDTVLGLEFVHVGINGGNKDEALKMAGLLSAILHVPARETESDAWVGGVEISGGASRGANGRLDIACNDLERAIFHLEHRGIAFDHSSKGVDSMGRPCIYFQDQIGGFALALVQR